MRDPSVETKYFCSSTNSTCELTNDTPATASAASFNFIRKVILVSSGTSNGSRLNALVHEVTTLSAWARTTLRDSERRIRAGDRHGLFRRRSRGGRLDAIGRGKAPRPVDEHPHAQAPAGRPGHALDLALPRRNRFPAVAVDPDIGVRCTERGRSRQRRVGRLGTHGIVRGPGLKRVSPRRHRAGRDERTAGREEVTSGDCHSAAIISRPIPTFRAGSDLVFQHSAANARVGCVSGMLKYRLTPPGLGRFQDREGWCTICRR